MFFSVVNLIKADILMLTGHKIYRAPKFDLSFLCQSQGPTLVHSDSNSSD